MNDSLPHLEVLVIMIKFSSFVVGSLVAVAAAQVAYHQSDIFSSKVDHVLRQATRWTEENISRDPKGYLGWAQGQVEEALSDLETQRIAISQNWNRFDRQRQDIQERIKVGQTTLKELKRIYLTVNTDEDLGFPYPYQGILRPESWYKQSIVQLQESIEAEELEGKYVQASLDRLQVEVNKLERLRSEVKEEERKITIAQREAQLNGVASDLQKSLAGIQDTMTQLERTTSDLMPTEIPTLESLVEKERYTLTFDESKFQAIVYGK